MRIAFRGLGFIVVLAVAYITATIVHENGHYIVAQVLGASPTIEYDYILSFIPLSGRVLLGGSEALGTVGLPATYLAGGVTAAIFPWVFLWLLANRTLSRGDMWIEGVAASVILTQLFYAPSELILWRYTDVMAHSWAATVLVFAGQFVFYFFYIKKIFRWIGIINGRKAAP